VAAGRAIGAQLARSVALSALAGSASVLAHLLASQHLPPWRVVLVAVAVLLLADLTAGTVLRGRGSTAVRVLCLQVGAHVLLVVGTVAAGSGPAVAAAGHHGAGLDTGAVDPAAGLLPSWPMLLAHAAVALSVAALLTRAEAAGREALGLPALLRAAARALASLLPVPAVPGVAPARPLRRDARTSATARPRQVWDLAAPVRRGPPTALAA
jgi:hypothetical protein